MTNPIAPTPPGYSHAEWNKLLELTYQKMKQLGELKGGEYSGDHDRLANFRRNGAALGIPMDTVWAVYAAKHWDAIMQFVQDYQLSKNRPRMESIYGRIDDLLVYLLLYKAILLERGVVGD